MHRLIGENMSQNIKNKLVLVLLILATSVLGFGAVIMLSGCNNFNPLAANGNAQKAENSAYFAQVNSISSDFKNILSDFSTCVKDKNVDEMKNKVENAQKAIDDFNKIDTPKSCKEIQKAYSDGYLQLQQALSDYVTVYSDYINGQMDANVLNERVASVQKSYNEGLELLKKADKLASDI